MFARSRTRSAWFFLITLLTIIYRTAGEPSRLIVCSQPNNFTVQITEKEHVVVYGTELLIRYDPYVGIFSFPGADLVNVVFNESIVKFKGYMSPEYPVTRLDFPPERLSWASSGIISGIGTLQKLSSEDYVVRDCRLLLPTDIKDSANLPLAVEDEIISYANSCIKAHLCQRLGTIKEKELQNINRHDELGPSVFIPRVIRPDNSPEQDCPNNLNISLPVDIALRNAIKYIKQNDKSVIQIPDVNETQRLETGLFGIKCNFQAINGTFEDLSTLKRTEDTVLSNIGQTYFIKGGFGLYTAKFNYDHYKLKAGLVAVDGKILGIIEGLALAASITIDYNQTCVVNLEYIKVTELGTVKIQMTGLGPLNSLTSTLLSWLTKKWQNDIIGLVQVNLKNIIEKELSDYICKKFYE